MSRFWQQFQSIASAYRQQKIVGKLNWLFYFLMALTPQTIVAVFFV